jgi:hypothetical protein
MLASAVVPSFTLRGRGPCSGLGTLEKAATRKYLKSRPRDQANQRRQKFATMSAHARQARNARSLRQTDPGKLALGSINIQAPKASMDAPWRNWPVANPTIAATKPPAAPIRKNQRNCPGIARGYPFAWNSRQIPPWLCAPQKRGLDAPVRGRHSGLVLPSVAQCAFIALRTLPGQCVTARAAPRARLEITPIIRTPNLRVVSRVYASRAIALESSAFADSKSVRTFNQS